MSHPLEVSRQGRLLRLTLDRPEKRNALNLELCEAIVSEVDRAQDDHGIGAILIEARGKVFCSGMDLDEALEPGSTAGLTVHERLFTIGERSTKPIVAAVQGPALAGGAGLVANAHIAVAAHGAQFGITELRVGMWPYVISRALATAMGERRVLELTLSSRIFGANEAKDYGLIHHVVPPVELDRAEAIALHISEWPSAVLALGMTYARRTREQDAEAVGKVALELRTQNLHHPDFAEGVAAFKEKRRPNWPSNRGVR